MRQKIGNLIITVLEVGCITGLTGLAINAEWKRHQAEKARSVAEFEASTWKFCNYMDSIKIKNLEKELEELKAKEEA